MKPGNPVTSIRTAARECKPVRSADGVLMLRTPRSDPPSVKRLVMFIAAAALALTPAAAAAKKPDKIHDRAAKIERKAKKAKPDSAQQRCRDERKALGPAAFAAKYGKARTKGSAKAKAKVARAAFGRCVSQTAKLIRAEREAAEEDEDEKLTAEEKAELEAEEREIEAEDNEVSDKLGEDKEFVDDSPEALEKPEPGDGGLHVDLD